MRSEEAKRREMFVLIGLCCFVYVCFVFVFQVSASAFAFLFSEMVQYFQNRVTSISDLERK